MRFRELLILSIVGLYSAGCAGAAHDHRPLPPGTSDAQRQGCKGEIKGEYIIEVKDPAAEQEFLHTIGDAAKPIWKEKHLYLLRVGDGDLPVRFRDRKKYRVDANQHVAMFATQADALFPNQCGLRSIHAEEAWRIAPPDRAGGITVAIVDSGIDVDHPDLDSASTDQPDELGHGTHLAGIIGADHGDEGVKGVVANASLQGYRFVDATHPQGTLDLAIEALRDAITASTRPKIVLMAWGTFCDFAPLEELIRDYHDILFVAAAGNSNTDLASVPVYPAALNSPNLITVMASTCADNSKATFSSFGDEVDLAAPGFGDATKRYCTVACPDSRFGILSTSLEEGYCCETGTSMAAAFVAGGAALVWAHMIDIGVADITPTKVKQCLEESADFSAPVATGHKHGLLNLLSAVDGSVSACK